MQAGLFHAIFKVDERRNLHSYNMMIFLIGERHSLILDGCFEMDCRNFLVSCMDWRQTSISENKEIHFSVFQSTTEVFKRFFTGIKVME
jgi:hypothetical protein